MATNTIVIIDNLNNQYQSQIESKTVAYPLVNRTLQADLLTQGDTVKVKYVNNIELDTAASSGLAISETNFVELSDDLVVDTTKNKNFQIKDIEEIRNSLNAQLKITELVSSAAARELDKKALATAVAGAGTTLNSATPDTMTKANIYAEIEEMRVVLDTAGLDGMEAQYLFIDAKRASLLRQSDVYAGTEAGLTARAKAYIGYISGFEVYQSNHIPTADAGVNTYMVAFDGMAINGAEQMAKFKVTDGANSMSSNVLYETVYGMDVLGLNPARIVASKITVA
jgi:hypothetical protein